MADRQCVDQEEEGEQPKYKEWANNPRCPDVGNPASCRGATNKRPVKYKETQCLVMDH